MLFFQAVLVLAYAYAQRGAAVARRTARALAPAAVAAPMVGWLLPGAGAVAIADEAGVGALLLALTTNVGLPFFALATTSPLVQHWTKARARNPFVLFAASNAGSLCGLLAYPLWLEPNLRLGEQRTVWAIGYGVVALAIALCSLRSTAAPRSRPRQDTRARSRSRRARPSRCARRPRGSGSRACRRACCSASRRT
jgi:hypothetical protein